MKKITTDLLVIGAGSGGLSVAAGAVQMGADVTLIEANEMGGDCLNFGCVPSKALLSAAKRAYIVQNSIAFGVTAGHVKIDYSKAQSHVRDTIATISPHDSQERFEGLGVRVIRAFARFSGRREVIAGDYAITARRIVIATGAHAAVPPVPGLKDVPYLTNETLFSIAVEPSHLVILGAGPIGMEMAQAHARLGVRVSMIEMAKFGAMLDPDAASILRTSLERDWVEIHDEIGLTSIEKVENGILCHLSDGRSIEGSHILVAAGRKPNLEGLDLERAGIQYDVKGIKVDAGLRTSNKSVYAIGDVAGGAQFTHVAGYHAGIVIRSALLGLPAKARTDAIPSVVYTDPEVAQVGLTLAQARGEYGARAEEARFDYAGNDRAIAERKTKGFAKAIIAGGRVVGATVVGHQAGEMINFWTYMVTHKEKISKVSAMIAPYPSLHEINKRVAGAYFSPRLFDSVWVKRVVRFVQKRIP
jgi:pyruvate/2-oxoglutarate dehydrogenase complex dihydrolipoamide dehydrogenase (E3) component